MTMKEIFMKEALKNIAKDWDISGESYEFTSVMNEYDFTFEKVETEEDKKRAYQIIDRLFVYLYPYLGGSRSDYMTTAIAKDLGGIGQVFLVIGIGTAVGVGMYLGFKYMTSGADEKAKVKERLIYYAVAIVLLVSAVGVTKIIVSIGDSI